MSDRELRCNYFDNDDCRSCSLLASSEPFSIEKKRERLLSAFAASRLGPQKIERCFQLDWPFPSRAKAKFSVSGSMREPIIGLLDRSLKGIPLLACPLHYPVINRLCKALVKLLPEMRAVPYDALKDRGELKGLIISCNAAEDQLMLRFVLRSRRWLPELAKWHEILLEQFPELTVISANIQPVPHQILEGEEEVLLSNEKFIWQDFSQLSMAYAPGSFMQVTPQLADILYAEGAEMLRAAGCRSVSDFFCGAGGFLRHAAKAGIRGIGYEIAERSLLAARETQRQAGLSGVDFKQVSLTDNLDGIEPADAAICNPPRRGLGEALKKHLMQGSESYQCLLYSSCNPDTLIADLEELRLKFSLERVQLYDMFPLTDHMEVLCLVKSVTRS